MAVGVLLVGLRMGVLGRIDDEHVRRQIGERVHAVRDERLGMTQKAADDFYDTE